MVGRGPGFYHKVTSVNKSRQTPYYNVGSHSKASRGRDLDGAEGRLVPLHPIVTSNISPTDKSDSQEELVGIRVEEKFSITDAS